MALAAAVPTIGVAVSTITAFTVALGVASAAAPTTLAILMLFPLSAFEATFALPAAAVALTRARIAAQRLVELVPTAEISRPDPHPHSLAAVPQLRADAVQAGYDQTAIGPEVTVTLEPGARLAITGRSGVGKTTLLMTLAGLLPPLSGGLRIDGVPAGQLGESELRSRVCYFAEDAHLFATTVRDNLLVARGDCADEELLDALRLVGLGEWVASLPDGLATVLHGGSEAVSAGQRRRLLLARALVCPAPILLLDEPTEHLSAADRSAFLRALLEQPSPLFGSDRTVIVATHEAVDRLDCQRLRVADVR